MIGAAANVRDRALLATTYGAGLRASEVVHLKVGDVDGMRMSLRVRAAKRAKDRYGLLSAAMLAELRAYWSDARKSGAETGPGPGFRSRPSSIAISGSTQGFVAPAQDQRAACWLAPVQTPEANKLPTTRATMTLGTG